jgi:hypothetical protein
MRDVPKILFPALSSARHAVNTMKDVKITTAILFVGP